MGHRGSCTHKATIDTNTLRKECIYLEACELLHGGNPSHFFCHASYRVVECCQILFKCCCKCRCHRRYWMISASTTQWYWRGIVKAALLK